MFKTVEDDLISRKDLWDAVDGLGTTAEYQEKIIEAKTEGFRQNTGAQFMGWAVGFSIALLHVREQLKNIQEDLKKHKRKFTPKTVDEIIWCMIQNRGVFRDNPEAFVRCGKDGGFEVFVPETNEVRK